MSDHLQAVRQTHLPRLRARGKVRDIYELDERHLMIVATDRISAFDVVMDQPIPGKGIVLTGMSRFWLETLPACHPHHLEYVVDEQHVPPGYEHALEQLRGRAMVVRRAHVLPVECVVRGYLAGGGWKEYRETGQVSGVPLPAGLRLADRLPEPIFTPSTKATVGHDQPISFEQACQCVAQALEADVRQARPDMTDAGCDSLRELGAALMTRARDRSLAIYAQASAYAERRGILIADTKFEFGLLPGWERSPDPELLLVDEVLTPDSSRFWPADQYRPGTNPPSFDKQFLRDYLDHIGWPRRPPPPPIPPHIIEQTRQRYLEAWRLLTGRELEPVAQA